MPQPYVQPEAPAQPDPAALLAALVAGMQPAAGEGLLLLGYESTPPEEEPVAEGTESATGDVPQAPRKARETGYRTLLVHTLAGGVWIEGELPYLMVPQPKGFLFTGEVRGNPGEPPRLWTAAQRGKIEATIRAEQKKLRGMQGRVDKAEQLVFMTSRVRCRTLTWTGWTAPSAWFQGGSWEAADAVSGAAIDTTLAANVDEATLRRFAGLATGSGDEGASLNLDVPFDANGHPVEWRKDPHICLLRERGVTQVSGSLLRKDEMIGVESTAIPLQTAPLDWAPSNALAIDFDAVDAAFPGALDAFVSPTQDVLVVLQDDVLVVYDVLKRRMGPKVPFNGRVVMVEWVTGDRVASALGEARNPTTTPR